MIIKAKEEAPSRIVETSMDNDLLDEVMELANNEIVIAPQFDTVDGTQSVLEPGKESIDAKVVEAPKAVSSAHKTVAVEETTETSDADFDDADAAGDGEEGESELAQVKRELAEAKAQTNNLIALLNDTVAGRSPFLSAGIEPQDVAPPTVTPLPAPVALPQFQSTFNVPIVDDDTLSDIVSSPEAFNTFIKNLAGAVRQQVVAEATVVAKNQNSVDTQLHEFFADKDNADIIPLRDVFMQLAINIEQSNPVFNLSEVLDKTAEILREKLALSKQMKGGGQSVGGAMVRRRRPGQPAPVIKAGPSVPGPKRSNGTQVYKTPLAQEIAELLG